MKLTRFSCIICTSLVLLSCASENSYTDKDVGKITHVRYGPLSNDREGEFMNGGARAGQGAGLIGIVAGTAAGAIIDGIRAEDLKNYDSVEYTIAMKRGDTHKIIQRIRKAEQPFKVGTQVIIDTSCRNLCVFPYKELLR